MNRSRFENRAKWLNLQREGAAGQKKLPVDMPRDEYWEKHVKTAADVETFYNIYYPSLPDVLVKALAHYYNRAIKGEIELPPNWVKRDSPYATRLWDYEAEIAEQRLQGQICLTEQRLAKLIEDEDEKKK